MQEMQLHELYSSHGESIACIFGIFVADQGFAKLNKGKSGVPVGRNVISQNDFSTTNRLSFDLILESGSLSISSTVWIVRTNISCQPNDHHITNLTTQQASVLLNFCSSNAIHSRRAPFPSTPRATLYRRCSARDFISYNFNLNSSNNICMRTTMNRVMMCHPVPFKHAWEHKKNWMNKRKLE